MWEYLGGLWQRGIDWLSGAFSGAVSAVVRALESAVGWLGDLLAPLVTAITEYLSYVLGPVWDLVLGILYFGGRIIEVIILVVQAVLLMLQILISGAGGLLRTVWSLATFDPAHITAVHNPYLAGTNLVLGVWSSAGGDIIALVFSWVIWMIGIWALLRLLLRE